MPSWVATRLVAPRELDDGKGEVARVGREEASSAYIPRNGCRGDAEASAGLGHHRSARLVSDKVSNEEQQEGDVQKTEEEDQADRGAEGGDEHDEGEDEPGREVDTKSVVDVVGSDTFWRSGRSDDTEPWNKDNSERPPESAVRAESSGTD